MILLVTEMKSIQKTITGNNMKVINRDVEKDWAMYREIMRENIEENLGERYYETPIF